MADVDENLQGDMLDVTPKSQGQLQSQQEMLEASGMDVSATTQYFAQHFLDQPHYSNISEKLSEKWQRLQSMSAAIRLMERYGVVIDAAEEDRIASLEESRQLEALVMKMPQDSKSEFEKFFLELQVLVSLATRVRRALDLARPADVEDVLREAENTGISPYIMRMAVVQAGAEVSSLKMQQKQWAKDMAVKMGHNVRSQEDAMVVKKKLLEAQRKLSIFTAGQNEKSKKVIMNFLNSSNDGLKAAAFKGWSTCTKQEKHEREIAGEFK
ncbi:unnamed protein product, partial [Prorocentrum cordatum]